MKLTKELLTMAVLFALAFAAFFGVSPKAIAADGVAALERGYRTGYSDGYMAGYRDVLDKVAKNYGAHDEYKDAGRGFSEEYGSIEDYKDGYKQGFEAGYDSGYAKRSFDSALPENLGRRGLLVTPATAAPSIDTPAMDTPAQPTAENQVTPVQPANAESQATAATTSDALIIILKDTDLVLELQDPLATNTSKEGDKFTAKVVSPAELTGAIIEGHVDKSTKPGYLKRRSELSLSFDRIVLNEKRWSNFSAILTEVLPIKGDNVRRIDDEGTAVGKSSMKPDLIKVGAATGAGAGIGAIAGGPVGAAVGAGVGAAFGAGAAVVTRGKHINLNKSQQLRIKTTYETQIR